MLPSRPSLAFVSESFTEELPNTIDIPIEEARINQLAVLVSGEKGDSQFGIGVSCTCHLWEIDNDRLSVFASDQDVKLVEITVNQSVFGKSDNELHERSVEIRGRVYGIYLPPTGLLAREMTIMMRTMG